MNMEEVKQRLINRIVEELEDTNINYKEGYVDGIELDIPFMIAPLYQEQCNDLLKPLLEDICTHTYNLHYEEDNRYTKEVIIQLEKNKDEYNEQESRLKEIDDYIYIPTDYFYEIIFDIDIRDYGYCQCKEDDKDYDTRYRCCGHGCDWDAPSISIHKVSNLGCYNWQGDEHDYWNFKDKFNNIDEIQKKEQERQAKVKQIKEQIIYYENKLKELEK